jgi:hypothetical protein
LPWVVCNKKKLVVVTIAEYGLMLPNNPKVGPPNAEEDISRGVAAAACS